MRRAPAILILLLVLAAGCGGGGSSDETTTGTDAAATSTDSTVGQQEAGPAGEGGGATEQGPGEEALAKAAVGNVLTSRDAERVCEEILTSGAVRTAYGDVKGCLDGRAPATLAASITFVDFELSGKTASATARPTGGVYDGEKVDAELARQGGAWRVTKLRADIPVGP